MILLYFSNNTTIVFLFILCSVLIQNLFVRIFVRMHIIGVLFLAILCFDLCDLSKHVMMVSAALAVQVHPQLQKCSHWISHTVVTILLF